jgi:hypothetical protein
MEQQAQEVSGEGVEVDELTQAILSHGRRWRKNGYICK